MKLSKAEFINLYRYDRAPCVSIYIPTHRAGSETKQDPIRLKNALSEADEKLIPFIPRVADRAEFLAEATDLLGQQEFWLHQDLGLSVFVGTDFFLTHRAPLQFENLVEVSERFHLKPLIPIMNKGGKYYLLALSKNRVRMYEGTSDSMRQIDQHDIPSSLADAVGHDWEQRSLQFHSVRQGNQNGAVHHGQGAASKDLDGEITTFLHRVDSGICKLLANDDAPLVVAAVERLYSAFASISKYAQLVRQPVRGNPDHLGPDELHEKSIDIVKPLLQFSRNQSIGSIARQLAEHDPRATTNLKSIVMAANAGRVDTLLLKRQAHCWGAFDPAEKAVVATGRATDPGAEDLLNLAAMETIAHNGSVYIVDESKMAPLFEHDTTTEQTGNDGTAVASLRFVDGTYAASQAQETPAHAASSY